MVFLEIGALPNPIGPLPNPIGALPNPAYDLDRHLNVGRLFTWVMDGNEALGSGDLLGVTLLHVTEITSSLPPYGLIGLMPTLPPGGDISLQLFVIKELLPIVDDFNIT